jgi:hypothetical protein
MEFVFPAPWLIPPCRVFDRELIEEPVLGDPLELLGHLQVFPGSGILLALWKVRRFNDQRVALEPADRVAEIGSHIVGAVLGVQPDDPRIVHHLNDDHDVVGRLNELVVVVVEAIGEHRRRAIAAERRNAALGATRFRVVERPAARNGARTQQ